MSVALGNKRSFSLGMIGGSSQPNRDVFATLGAYLRDDEKRRVRYHCHAIGSRVIREAQCRLTLAPGSKITNPLQPGTGQLQVTQNLRRDVCRVKNPSLPSSNEFPSTGKQPVLPP